MIAKATANASPDHLTDIEKATAYCQSNLSAAQLDALGGLSACAQAYVAGGVSAVQGLLNSLGDLMRAVPAIGEAIDKAQSNGNGDQKRLNGPSGDTPRQ